jgi:hypothetical protein
MYHAGFIIYISRQILLKRAIIVQDVVVTACVSHGRKMNFTTVLIKKPHGTREILGSRRGWENDIKMDLRWVNVC